MVDLYTWTTPNGRKVSIMLEELGLPYAAHAIDISKGEQHKPEFLKISPNNRIPAIVDPDGPGGKPISLFESGAILIYLAEKTGRFLSKEPVQKYKTLEWLMWQVGGVGPMFGQWTHFKLFAPKGSGDYSMGRYTSEIKRLYEVLETRLGKVPYLGGQDYSVADIATFPWVRNLIGFYGAGELVGIADFPNVTRALDAFVARPAVARGLLIPAKDTVSP